MRHYSQIVPRDFDLSPNFQVIKCEIFEAGGFDDAQATWPQPAAASAVAATARAGDVHGSRLGRTA